MENKKHVEANALTPIKENERQGWVSLAFVQAGICVCASSFWEGAILAESMPLGEAIISGTLGYSSNFLAKEQAKDVLIKGENNEYKISKRTN